MRKAISKKLRFEIFKRDKFKCKYCGEDPSRGIILNIDHIIPVAKGGTNDELNLITACFDCNAGKSDRELSSVSNLKINIDKNALKEYKEQIKVYFDYLNEKTAIVDQSVDLVLQNIGDAKADFNETQRNSIKIFIKKLNLESVIEYSMLSSAKMGTRSSYTKFKYLCGICHNKIKSLEAPNV